MPKRAMIASPAPSVLPHAQRAVHVLRDRRQARELIADLRVARQRAQRRDAALERGLIAVVERQRVRRRRDVLQHEILADGALHALERVREPLVLERRGGAVGEHDLALGRELAELDHGVADGDEQRHGDEREAHQHHAEQRSRPPHLHSVAPSKDHERQCPAASFRSHSSDVVTILARSSCRGCQPSVARIRAARATNVGGSPARRGSSLLAIGCPATLSTMESSSRTL